MNANPVDPGSRGHGAAWLLAVTGALSAFYLLSYGDALGAFFHLDDYWTLARAARLSIRTPGDLVGFLEPTQSLLLYRPLSTLYFYTLHGLFGTDPRGFHAVHLGLHVANAVLTYAIASRLFLSRPLAAAVSLVYAAAPGHAQATYWVALFTVTGTAFLYYLGLWTWLRGAAGRWRVPATLALFAVMLLASEHAVSFPLALTLAALLMAPRPDWRRLGYEQVWFYGLLAIYLAVKMSIGGFLVRRAPPADPGLAQVWAHYRISFAPESVLTVLGRYLAFGLGPLYDPGRSEAQALALGGLVAGLAAVAVGSVWWGRWTSRPLRVAAFGLALFAVALGPVVVLPTHIYSGYVGVAMLGLALAVVGFAAAVPRVPGLAVAVLVALLLGVHVHTTGPRVQQSTELFYLRAVAGKAARWLHTLARLDGQQAIEEVVVPADDVTNMLFDRGNAARVFLCAPYRVRTTAAIGAESPAPGRVVLPGPVAALPADCRAWGCARRNCPAGDPP